VNSREETYDYKQRTVVVKWMVKQGECGYAEWFLLIPSTTFWRAHCTIEC
jgi:hypothetical protein